MAKAEGSVAKTPRPAGNRRRKPKASASVAREVSPEAIERFAKALSEFFCAVGRPDDGAPVSVDERPSRAQRGAEYLAAIAEQRPGVNGHGYPGGYPDWDQTFRLTWSGTTKAGIEISNDRSIMLPDWMALPLVRSLLQDPELRQAFIAAADKSDETDTDRIKDA